MQILHMRTLHGPNIYSYKPVLFLKVALGQYENAASNTLAGFIERLLFWLPGLHEHQCSLGYRGGFVKRLHEGTYLAHIFEHCVLELQCRAGYPVSFGKARQSPQAGIYDVVVGFKAEAVARQAAVVAEELINAAIADLPFAIAEKLAGITQAAEKNELGPSTKAIYEEACKRDIPVSTVPATSLLIMGYGRHCKRVRATITENTSALASDLVSDKHLTNALLEDNGIPVPVHRVVATAEQALRAFEQIGWPVVVKPLTGNHGNGVTLNIKNAAELERAYQLARQYDEAVLVEKYIRGQQYRLCVVNGKMVAAAERIPAYVIGDGIHSITELVELANANPLRGQGHSKPLTRIAIDAVAVTVLAKQNLTPQSVPGDKQVVRIRDSANISTGGTSVDVTAIVHPDTLRLAERIARLTGLDVAGIDLVAEDITRPVTTTTGAVIEVNAAPGIRMHQYPAAGKAQNVAGAIVDYLYPGGESGRIPIIAVTGTNGKTTVTRMISHIWQQAGYRVGMTTTDGIYLNGECILEGDTTGPGSAKIILHDPKVEVAVLETARGGIVRGGLAFDKCDVGLVTNITEDHLGQDGIEDLEDLAYIKSLVLEVVRPEGTALINADDPFVAAMASRTRAEVVYFSIEANNIIIRRHLGAGGKVVFVKEDTVYVAWGSQAKALIKVSEIPVTLGGIALHNLQNAVIAAAACYCAKVPVHSIRQGLASFAQNPGRLTLLTVGSFRVCVDYGHNPAGYQALINTARRLGAARLVGIIAAPGDRRDDITINIGRIAGQGFDYLYIKEDQDLRGRLPGETAKLLRQGALEAGFASERIQTVLSEPEAVRQALLNAKPGDLLIVFYEQYDVVMKVINDFTAANDEENEQQLPVHFENVVVAGVKNG